MSGEFTRRDFVKFSMLTSGSAFLAACAPELTQATSQVVRPKVTDKPLPPPVRETIKPTDVLVDIQKTTGVFIPQAVSDEYKLVYDGAGAENVEPLNIVPTVEEGRVIKASLMGIPNRDRLSKLLIPYRSKEIESAPQLLGTFDRFGYSEPAVVIVLPGVGKKLDDTQLALSNPSLTSTNEIQAAVLKSYKRGKFNLNTPQDNMYDNTLRNMVEVAIPHEYFNAWTSYLTWIRSNEEKKVYKRIRNNNFLGFFATEINNPAFVEFAFAAGYKLFPLDVVAGQYDPELAEKVKSEESQPPLVWERDPKVWGPARDRQARVSSIYTYGPIQMAISEGYAAWHLKPDSLSSQEQEFYYNSEKLWSSDDLHLTTYNLVKKYFDSIPKDLMGDPNDITSSHSPNA